ncbi:MAG: DUF6789 family protein [Brumimicrobium sp.]
MELSIFLLTVLSGFAGTIAMTIVMYVYAHLAKKNTKVIHIFGSMVTGNTGLTRNYRGKMLATGTIAHVFVGVLFSFSYFLLWNWGVFDITLSDSFIVGLLSGVIAIIVWRIYFFVHQKPPKIFLPHYFAALLISHVLFGLVTVNVFNLIADNPQFWFQI